MAIVNFASRDHRFPAAAYARSPGLALAVVAAIHIAALAILYQTEWGLVHGTLAVLGWGFLNERRDVGHRGPRQLNQTWLSAGPGSTNLQPFRQSLAFWPSAQYSPLLQHSRRRYR